MQRYKVESFDKYDMEPDPHGIWVMADDATEAIATVVAAERERCAKLCEWLPIGTGLHGKTFAEAIRGKGLGGKMAHGFGA